MAKVAKQIEREVGSLLIYDRVVQEAVCPERRRGMDGALSALASVTEVHISNDLQVAKVYLSVYSDDEGKAAAMAGLQRLEGYVRGQVGRQMRLRLTPEIRFVMDESIERTERVFKLLDRVRAIEAGEEEPPPVAIGDYEDEAEDESEDESEDEGIASVDLGFFGSDSEPAAAAGSGRVTGRKAVPAAGGRSSSKEGAIELGVDEVEEMMALFRQESAAGGARRRGGGSGGRGGGGRPSRGK